MNRWKEKRWNWERAFLTWVALYVLNAFGLLPRLPMMADLVIAGLAGFLAAGSNAIFYLMMGRKSDGTEKRAAPQVVQQEVFTPPVAAFDATYEGPLTNGAVIGTLELHANYFRFVSGGNQLRLPLAELWVTFPEERVLQALRTSEVHVFKLGGDSTHLEALQRLANR